MKAEHRKELETNVLADYLGSVIQKAKEGPSQKVLLYGGLILLVVVLIGLFIYFSTRSKDSDALRWDQWNRITQATSGDVSDAEVAKLKQQYPGKSSEWCQRLADQKKFEADNPGTPQARLARFQQARLLLENTQEMASQGRHRDTTLQCVREGRDLYDKLIGESSDEPYLEQEAMLNAGKASEDLAEYDRARQYYERLKKDYPKSQDAAAAEKALARLSNEKDLELLKKLAESK
jgi:hypothetical protein